MNESTQEKVMEALTGMVMVWSSHVTGQKPQADAIQEIRKNTASVLGWLDDLERGVSGDTKGFTPGLKPKL